MKIALRPLKRSDFPVIRDWIDPKVFRIFKEPIDDTQLKILLTKHDNGKPTDLGISAVDIESGSIVGFLHVVIDWKNELAHIQQILVGIPEMRRQGFGAQMLNATLTKCFDELKLHRVQTFVDEENMPSISFFQNMGFKIDGLMRDAAKVEDRFLSWYCLSLLSSEWKG